LILQSNNENKNVQQSNEDDDLKFMRALEQCRSKAEEELVEKAHRGSLSRQMCPHCVRRRRASRESNGEQRTTQQQHRLLSSIAVEHSRQVIYVR
jgi:hypothetical protein